jgi:Zn-dependent M28 family amino/carboxypeptidase
MKKSCTNVSLQAFTHEWTYTHETVPMWNIIGEQDYKDAPVKIALFAHWDTRPFADQETERTNQLKPIPGADDGASGVAVLLQMMKELKDKHPGVGILYVMLDGEDLGPGEDEMYLGATVFAKRLGSVKPDYGILLDMIGGKNLKVPKETNSSAAAPRLMRMLYLHAAKMGLGTTFPNSEGMTIDDDHLPIIKAGVPTIDLIDLTYPQWHTLADTPEHCSPESLDKVGALLESWLTSKEAVSAADKG